MRLIDVTDTLPCVREFELPPLLEAEACVFAFKLQCGAAEMAFWSDTLSPSETERAGRFRTPQLRIEFVAAHGMLRWLLGQYLDVSPASVEYVLGPHGKPALAPQMHSPLRFNLAHSGGLGVVGLALGREIGVDIEALRPLSVEDLSSNSVWTPDERSQLERLGHEDREAAFYTGWVRKEACLKACGMGLAQGGDFVSVSLCWDDPRPIRTVQIGSPEEWIVSTFRVSPSHVGAVALALRT